MAGIADIIRSLRGVGSDVANEGFSGFLPDWYKEKIVPSLEKFGGSLSGPTMLGDSAYADTMIRGQKDKSIQSPDADAGVKDAAIEATNLAGQNVEGLGNFKPHSWRYSLPESNMLAAGTDPLARNTLGTDDDYLSASGVRDTDLQTPPNDIRWHDPIRAPEDRDLSAYAGERTDWTTPQGAEPAPFVGGPSDYEPGGREVMPDEYMARQDRTGDHVGGGQGFDLLGWLNKLPSGQKMRDADLARPNFGSKRPGTTYDGSIQGGGYFTPEEYGRHYSQYGRGS